MVEQGNCRIVAIVMVGDEGITGSFDNKANEATSTGNEHIDNRGDKAMGESDFGKEFLQGEACGRERRMQRESEGSPRSKRGAISHKRVVERW